jgi:hypothetical protein
VKLIEEHLKRLKLNIVCEGIALRFAPGESKRKSLKTSAIDSPLHCIRKHKKLPVVRAEVFLLLFNKQGMVLLKLIMRSFIA